MKTSLFILSCLTIFSLVNSVEAGSIDPALASALVQLAPAEKLPVWIFFQDRGMSAEETEAALQQLESVYPQKTINRRHKAGVYNFCQRDLPVCQVYIDQVRNITGKIRTITRYFNGVSADLNWETAEQIAALPYVDQLIPVAQGKRYEPVEKAPPAVPLIDYEYGESFGQLNQINVIAMHDMGLTGGGVLVCLLDTGYRLQHIAFANMDIVDTWDFINGDSIVYNQPEDPSDQQNHGTYTLSTCGGQVEGYLYGPAFDASFLAYKTEMVDEEIPIEEDYYVAGLERADSLGADVVSTSLGYYDWYEFEDLDGNTTVTAIGVDIAVTNGIVCVTAAGNNRNYMPFPYIITPADADSVISVGAVDIDGELASFSSPGPTYDGRTKPEVCAMGVDTYCASPYNLNGFTNVGGTSLSTPLVGGASALLVQAHPNWPPMMVREALMMTASNAGHPNNDYGWGIIDVLAAAQYSFPPVIQSVQPDSDTVYVFVDSTVTFIVDAADEDGDPLLFSFYVDTVLAEENDTGFFNFIPTEVAEYTIYVTVEDLIGFQDNASWVVIGQPQNSIGGGSNLLLDNFYLEAHPNPFNSRTIVDFSLPQSGKVNLSLYNINGSLICTIAEGTYPAGQHSITVEGKEIASGVYFLRMSCQGKSDALKLLLLR